jgi:hypothetical protein
VTRNLNEGSNVLSGLLRSGNLAASLGSIPCNVVDALSNDAEAAANFINQLQAGQVPDLIADLPETVFNTFKSAIDTLTQLPEAVVNAASDAVETAERIFDDIGSGDVEDLGEIAGEVIEDIWNGFTAAGKSQSSLLRTKY